MLRRIGLKGQNIAGIFVDADVQAKIDRPDRIRSAREPRFQAEKQQLRTLIVQYVIITYERCIAAKGFGAQLLIAMLKHCNDFTLRGARHGGRIVVNREGT